MRCAEDRPRRGLPRVRVGSGGGFSLGFASCPIVVFVSLPLVAARFAAAPGSCVVTMLRSIHPAGAVPSSLPEDRNGEDAEQDEGRARDAFAPEPLIEQAYAEDRPDQDADLP